MKPTPHPPSPHLAFARARYQCSSPPAFDPRSPPLSRTYAQSAAYTPSHSPLPFSSSPSSPECTRATDGLSAAVDCPCLSSLADRIHLRRTRRMRPVSPPPYISPYQSHTSRLTRPIHPAAYTPPALPLAFHFPSTYLPLPLHLPSASHLHLGIQRRRNYKAALWREVRRSRRRVETNGRGRGEDENGDEAKGEECRGWRSTRKRSTRKRSTRKRRRGGGERGGAKGPKGGEGEERVKGGCNAKRRGGGTKGGEARRRRTREGEGRAKWKNARRGERREGGEGGKRREGKARRRRRWQASRGEGAKEGKVARSRAAKG